jgi:DNA-binding NtrC family response regulator
MMTQAAMTNGNAAAARLLIADDQSDVLIALQILLKGEGFVTDAATSPAGVIEKLSASSYDLLLMDMNYARDTTSGREGLDLLSQVRHVDETLPVVVMTAWASIDLVVEAMRNGLCDFVQKPIHRTLHPWSSSTKLLCGSISPAKARSAKN